MLETIFNRCAAIFNLKNYFGFCRISTVSMLSFLYFICRERYSIKSVIISFAKIHFIKFLLLFLFHFYHLLGFFFPPSDRLRRGQVLLHVNCQVTDTWLNTSLFSVMSVFVKLKFRKVCFILAVWSCTKGVAPKCETSLIYLNLNFCIFKEINLIKEGSIDRLCLFFSMFLELQWVYSIFV